MRDVYLRSLGKKKTVVRQAKVQQQAKAHEELTAAHASRKLQTTLTMMQSQNQAFLQLLSKMSDKEGNERRLLHF